MSKDNTDSIIGAVAVLSLVAIGGFLWLMPHHPSPKKATEEIAAAEPIPSVAPSDVIKSPKTLDGIFNVLKNNTVTVEEFNGLFSMAGVTGLPSPPPGWQYVKSKAGIGLKPAENLANKIKN